MAEILESKDEKLILLQRKLLLERAVSLYEKINQRYNEVFIYHNYDEEQILRETRGIPFHLWCQLMLYSPKGYYGGGVAKINETGCEFATIVGSLSDVETLLREALAQLQTNGYKNTSPCNILSLNHGNGDFERTVHILKQMYPETFGYINVVSMDISAGMLAKSSIPNKLQADAGKLPFADGSFDIIFSNELYDCLNIFQVQRENDTWFVPMIGFDFLTRKRFVFYLPCSTEEDQLIGTYAQYLSDQGKRLNDISEITIPIGAISVQKESARVIGSGGIVISCDYVAEHDTGGYTNYVITYPGKRMLPKSISEYTGGDITSMMEPSFVTWSGNAFGLKSQTLTPLEALVRRTIPLSLGEDIRQLLLGNVILTKRLASYPNLTILFQSNHLY